MPGAYAHITLVNMFREPARLDLVQGFSAYAKQRFLKLFKFCELGAVGPDYPYLAIGNSSANKWADRMHYEKTGATIKAGIYRLKTMNSGISQDKALVWLLGYMAHVVTDATIHPVVETLVGTYAKNKTAHRVCELHQDAYIFQRLNLGSIGLAEFLDSGIGACCDKNAPECLDSAVATLWTGMLSDCFPKEYRSTVPDPIAWHRCFRAVVDKVEEGGCLWPAARHLAVNCGITYPSPEEVDSRYISNLPVPCGGTLHYDQIFNQAVENVAAMWGVVLRAVLMGDDQQLALIDDWNLDTGRNCSNKYVFWS